MEEISRRGLLRNGSAGVFAVGTAGLAGCTSSIPGFGDDYSGANIKNWLVGFSFADFFQESEWKETLYQGGEIDDSEREIDFAYVAPEPFLDHEEELSGYSQKMLEGEELRGKIGVPLMETDWALTQSVTWQYSYSYEEETWGGDTQTVEDRGNTGVSIGIASGSFDTDDIADNLERWIDDRTPDEVDGTEYELASEGEYEGYQLYQYEVENTVFAVDSNHVLEVSGGDYLDTIELAEAVLDVRWNQENRLADEEDGEALLSRFDTGHYSTGTLHEPLSSDEDDTPSWQGSPDLAEYEEGLVGKTTSYELDGSETDISEIYLYETERDADAETLREHVDVNRDLRDDWPTMEDYSISDHDRTLVLNGTMRTRIV
ncbi:hypothetical protein ACFO5R_06330 [Halosolutus amylolyticus]|uniref:Uncharacterized protein n=1 Tax=Halosolutus amylolyticus TaxID=2932267 RepID=A0ABD5PMD0_9EURY|nr:hypothetical protein [Halosolutus amylolyticus]